MIRGMVARPKVTLLIGQTTMIRGNLYTIWTSLPFKSKLVVQVNELRKESWKKHSKKMIKGKVDITCMHANYILYTFNRKKIEGLVFHSKMNVPNPEK